MSDNESLRDLRVVLQRLGRKVQALENTPWLHPKDVMAILGISKATLYRYLKCGRLPRPSRIYGPIWRRCDLDKALDKSGRPRRTRQAGQNVRVRPRSD